MTTNYPNSPEDFNSWSLEKKAEFLRTELKDPNMYPPIYVTASMAIKFGFDGKDKLLYAKAVSRDEGIRLRDEFSKVYGDLERTPAETKEWFIKNDWYHEDQVLNSGLSERLKRVLPDHLKKFLE